MYYKHCGIKFKHLIITFNVYIILLLYSEYIISEIKHNMEINLSVRYIITDY